MKKQTKRQSKPKTKVVSSKKTEQSISQSLPEMKSVTPKKISMPILIIIAVILGGLFFFRDWVVAVTVNGKPISRLALIHELEKQGGKQVMDALVTEELIRQEAAKQGVVVSQDTIDAEIASIEESLGDQKLEDVLVLQNMTMDELTQQIKLQKTVEALAAADVNITDEEVAAYITENAEMLPADMEEAELDQMVRDQLSSQKTQSTIQEWLANLKSGARINYWAQL